MADRLELMQQGAKSFWMESRAQMTFNRVMLPLRLYLGLFYILTGSNKIGRGGLGRGFEENLVEFVTGALEKAPSWYAAFLETVVLKIPTTFTLLVSWGEFCLGLTLLLGIFVRLSGFLGAFMALNFALASGRALWLPSFDVTLALALLTLAMAAAGRSFGADYFLARCKNSRWLW